LTFSFEDDFTSIDEVLHEINAVIFRMPQEPMEWVQLDWSNQLHHALECYNVTSKEEDKDPRNINIPEVEGHHEVKSLQIYNLDITASLKTKQANIGTKAEPKLVMVGDYWDDATVDKFIELLHKY